MLIIHHVVFLHTDLNEVYKLLPDFHPKHGVIWIEQNAEFPFEKVLEAVDDFIKEGQKGEMNITKGYLFYARWI